MMSRPYFLIVLISVINCERFAREELGISDRLRFTSGEYGYYNCTVIADMLISNLKIGIYIHNQKTIIQYKLNDTVNFAVQTERVENFYFAHISVKSAVENTNLKLLAFYENSDLLIDETSLKIFSTESLISTPKLLNSSTVVIKTDDNILVASVVGVLMTVEKLSKVLFSINIDYISHINDFAVTTDGRILVTKTLDSKNKNSYTFKVDVKFVGAKLAETITVHIKVMTGSTRESIVDKKQTFKSHKIKPSASTPLIPELSFKTYNFTMSEFAPKSTIVGKIRYDHKIDQKLSYKLKHGNDNKVFHLNEYSGLLTVSYPQGIDYEKKRLYEISVSAFINLYINVLEATITIHVTDENDNVPIFNQPEYALNVSEDTLPGKAVLQVIAKDEDSHNNGKISYALMNEEKVPFTVESDGIIRTSGELNILSSSVSVLYVHAFDWGFPRRQETETTVTIHITSVNTHNPILKQSSCQVMLPYSQNVDDVLMTFEAVDQDVVDDITYHFVKQNNKFILNKTSGDLKLSHTLFSNEDISNVMLYVYAFDGSHRSSNILTTITFGSDKKIRCTENSEYRAIKELLASRKQIKLSTKKPTITKRPLVPLKFPSSLENKFAVSEDAPIGTSIGTISVSDTDIDSIILYNIVSGNNDGMFQIDLKNGSLFVLDTLDREIKDRYSLKIRASDIFEQQTAELDVEIDISDVNDNPPVFTNNGFYEFKAQEGKQAGYPLGTVSATDKDLGVNQEIEYSFIAASQLFDINKFTGVVTLKSAFSVLSSNQYTIEVLATDKSVENQLVNYATVHISVTGISNRPPKCLKDQQKIEIPSNMPAGVIVGRVFGYDLDAGKAGDILYMVSSKTSLFDDYFTLDSKTGLIKLKRSFSQTDKGLTFSISVTLTDSGTPRLSTVCRVYKIVVDEINSNRPTFNVKGTFLEFSIYNDESAGHVITKLEAKSNQAIDLFYEIIDGDGIGIFGIDEVVGVLSVSSDNFLKTFYWLTVQACFKNTNVFRNIHILIKILLKRPIEPFFSPSVYRVTLPYSVVKTREVIRLYAQDRRNSFNNDIMKFALFSQNENNNFLVKSNGLVYTTKAVKEGEYELNVTVTADNSFYSHGTVFIHVIDQSYAPPFFEYSETIFVFKTSANIKAPYLFQSLAINPSPENQLTYKISPPSSLFEIDATSAVITSKKPLHDGDLEFLDVTVTNSLNQNTVTSYVIQVIDIPEKSTELAFKQASYSFAIKENEAEFTIVDLKDEILTSSNELVQFFITSGNDNLNFFFSPSLVSTLNIIKPLDYELQPKYVLEIVAFNGWTFSKTHVIINVVNINDNILTSSQACFEARIHENTNTQRSLITVRVSDADHPDHLDQQLNYNLINDPHSRSPFEVSKKGLLSVKSGVTFDREYQNEHIVTVTAGSRKENATFCVKVLIQDDNDHSPKFTQSVTRIDILDSTPIGTSVLSVYAMDADEGTNSQLVYSILDNSEFFEMNLKTGVIYITKELQLNNTARVISMGVSVSDQGNPPRSDSAKVEISLVPDLDGLKFRRKNFQAYVMENIRIGSLVSGDIKVNQSSVNYVIKKLHNDCVSLFWIDPFTGILLTNAVLDADKLTVCDFMVLGVLNGIPITSATVHVDIKDCNDPPVFEQLSYEGTIVESLMVNSKVLDNSGSPLVVKAVDEDIGADGRIKYKFVEEFIQAYFTLNEVTGEILTNYVLDFEKHSSHFKFHIAAYDEGPSPLFTIVPVTINLTNVNDRMPYFKKNEYLKTLFLPVFNGTSVIKVTAHDDDISSEIGLKYSMLSGGEWFAMNSETGEITVHNPLLSESQSPLIIKASVSDGFYSAVCQIDIQMFSYQPLKPFRFLSDVQVSVKENVKGPLTIVLVNPVGYQIGEQLDFQLLNLHSFFTISERTGIVSIKDNIVFDREVKSFYLLHVEVHLVGKITPLARTSVNVTIQDENDNSPIFIQSKYYRAVDIEVKGERELLQVVATDLDSGNNSLIFYSITSNMEYFSCDPESGVISLAKDFIKSETKPKYMFQVKAQDHGDKSLSSLATVIIPVVNKDQPIISNNYYVTVSEFAQEAHHIVSIIATGRNNRQVYYQISSGDEYQQFHIGFTTGELSVSGTLDYLRKHKYHLVIKAIDSLTGSWSEAECDVTVMDVNNNAPMFEQSFYNVTVNEDILAGSSVIKVTALDNDSGSNADITYSISSTIASTLSLFNIDSKSGIITTSNKLDAETETFHLIHVTATDNGEIPKASSTSINITVLDINDNKPKFYTNKLNFFIDDIRTKDQFVSKIEAFDADINHSLNYSLKNPSPYLKIHDVTGVLSIKDRPPPSTMLETHVQVTDGKYIVDVQLSVTVNTRNENKPYVPHIIPWQIQENSENRNVKDLAVNDADMGIYSKLSYQIDSDKMKKYFRVNKKGTVSPKNKALDREKFNKFIVPIRVTDGGGLFTLTKVVVEIQDDNDNTPMFEFPLYQTNVMTSQMYEESLLHVVAKDMDIGKNAELTYNAHGLDVGSVPLSINNKKGLISLAGNPKGVKYQFSIQTSDNGYPVRQSRTDIEIAVKSWNRKILRFSNAPYRVSVKENKQIHSLLLTVKATLENYNGTIFYQFMDGNWPYTDAENSFNIESKSGKVFLKKELDFEYIQEYKLMVRAFSESGDDVASCFVYIDVINVNDNLPKFDSREYSFKISEGTSIGQQILQVIASDADQINKEQEDELSYSIISGDSDLFSLNSSSGWLTVREQLDREKKSKLNLKVRVVDRGNQYDDVMVIIELVDVNDSPPLFENNQYDMTVSEDALIQDVILTIKTYDADLNSRVEYFVERSSHSGTFTLNKDTGDLSVVKTLTFTTYEITVIAYDGVHTSYANVHIKVKDVNNNSPICLHAFYNINVNENSLLNTTLATVQAVDHDPDDSLYYTVQGDGIGKFTVANNSGEIKAVVNLDFEYERKHTFKVVVKDTVGHSCWSDVFVTLIDENDNQPKFLLDSYVTTIREEASKSAVVTQVEARDKDSYDNRKIAYSLLNNVNNVFDIGERGIVTVSKPHLIQRQKTSKFTLTVIATDNGTVPLQSNTLLDIIVLSVKDTPPRFDKLGYVFNVSENNAVNAVLGNLNVKITENLKLHQITVAIINDNTDAFSIDEEYVLKARKSFDYEEQQIYSFSIKLWFVDIPSLSSVVNVEVQIEDVNDNAPLFNHINFAVNIDENIRDGTFVLQAFAKDNDASKENSVISYHLLSNENLPFLLNSQNGILTVNGIIDHEIRTHYRFNLYAQDNGKPQLRTKAKVVVDVNDLNDNRPVISDYNATIIIQDDKLPGSNIMKLKITDLDSKRNGAPFKCSLVNGNFHKFDVTTEDGKVCAVKTKTKFEINKENTFDLKVRVKDSGVPQQYSDSDIKVLVVEESYHAPVIQDPKVFYVIVSKPYVVTKIGKIEVFDKDVKDIHQYKIIGGNHGGYFTIQSMAGIIEGKPPVGTYTLAVDVSDGKYSDSSIFKIYVNEIDDDIQYNSLSVTIHNIDAKYFIDVKMVKFNEVLAKVLGGSLKDIFVWSVQTASLNDVRKRRDTVSVDSTVIAVAVRNPDEQSYMDPSLIEETVVEKQSDFNEHGIEYSVSSTQCLTTGVCLSSQKCVVTFTPREMVSPYLPSGYMGFVNGESCVCKDGLQGSDCSKKTLCANNPCKAGHKCVEALNSYTCECIDESSCDKDSTNVVTLSGSSYLKYKLRKSFDELFDTMKLSFRTENEDRVTLFDASGKDSFKIEIKNGFIQCKFDFGGGFQLIKLPHLVVTDGKWHEVVINRNGNYVSMEVDNQHKDFISGEGPHTKININDELNIVFGGRLVGDEIVTGFHGCLKNLYLHDELLPFEGGNDIISKVTRNGLRTGCTDSGLCSIKHCPSFSNCVNTFTDYKCVCLPGHHGEACSSDMTCEDRPCQNNGMCTLEQMNDDITYKCTCKPGYTGEQCQVDLKACASNPCFNNAKCISSDVNKFQCVCPAGFSGDQCQINVNPCASNPCRNGGVCSNFYGSFKCNCPAGEVGVQCSSGENCRYLQCENGGQCQELKDRAFCECRGGYRGTRCQNDLNECLESGDPCVGGVCVNTYGEYYCNCTNGRKDKTCALASTGSGGGPPFIIIGAAVGGLFFLIFLVGTILCCTRRRKSRYEATAVYYEHPTKRQLECEMANLYVPTPPLRGIAVAPKYDECDQASAAMYDPSALTSGASSPDDCVKVKLSPARTSIEYQSDDEGEDEKMPGYHWDYSEVPLDMMNTQMSREGSRLGLTKTDQYFEDEDDQLYVDIPKIPERPASRRSSMPTCTDCDEDIPELPELPQQIRQSRQSLGNNSPSSNRMPDLQSNDFNHRYSLLPDKYDNVLEGETVSDITNVTRLYTRADLRSEASDLSDELDGLTETSLNSDDDDLGENDPLDPENTRKLERDIKKLFKDLQKRTEEDI